MQKHFPVSPSHSAVNVDVVTTPGGLKFWLVPSYAVPLVSLEFAMRGGAAQDPAAKAGLGALTAALLDEGAGDLNSQAFHRALDEKAVEMSFHCDRDHWSGRMRTLTKNLDRAAELLRLAVNAPRFDEEPFERVREHMNARLRHDANDPATLANRNWKAKSFPHHPYGQPADGTLETLARIERADLVDAARRGIARDQLLIAVVGAIDEKDAAALVDKAFADLPARGKLKPVAEAAFVGLGAIEKVDLDVPQSTIRFGRPALKRDDPDFIPSVVAAHVLGGSGSMTSRLFREVREKRGLAYTVFGTFYSLEHGAYFYGGTTTKNERAREILRRRLGGDPRRGAERAQRRGAGERQDLSHRLLSAALRHIRQDRFPARPYPARAPGARVAGRAQSRDRRGDDGERQARRASRLRRRLATYDRGRPAGGVLNFPSPSGRRDGAQPLTGGPLSWRPGKLGQFIALAAAAKIDAKTFGSAT